MEIGMDENDLWNWKEGQIQNNPNCVRNNPNCVITKI